MTPNESEIEPSTITMTLKEFKAYCDRERAAAHARGREEGLEEAAKECERIWKEAPNERTDSPLTSFRQNEISHGCVACAAAIRALNPKER